MKGKIHAVAAVFILLVYGCQAESAPVIVAPDFAKKGVDCTVPDPHPSCKDDGGSGGGDISHTVALSGGIEMAATAAEVSGPKGKLGTTTLGGGGTVTNFDMNLTETAVGEHADCVASVSKIPPDQQAAVEAELRNALLDFVADPHTLEFTIDVDATLAGEQTGVPEIHLIGPGGAGGGGIWVRIGHNNEAAQDPPVPFVTVTYDDGDPGTPNEESIIDPTATRVFTFEGGEGGLVRSITRVDVDGNGLRGNDPTASLQCHLKDDVVLTISPAS